MTLVVGGGCGSPRAGGFDSALPGARLDAIEYTLKEWRATPPDRRELSRQSKEGLVESLRSEDPLVRFAAIEALAEMTGERNGYRYDDSRLRRTAAIETWILWAHGEES